MTRLTGRLLPVKWEQPDPVAPGSRKRRWKSFLVRLMSHANYSNAPQRGRLAFGPRKGLGGLGAVEVPFWFVLVVILGAAIAADVYRPLTRAWEGLFGTKRALRSSKVKGSIGGF